MENEKIVEFLDRSINAGVKELNKLSKLLNKNNAIDDIMIQQVSHLSVIIFCYKFKSYLNYNENSINIPDNKK